jgi:UDP-glucose 4-epimerase
MTEDIVPAPEDPYGIAKFAVEQDLRESFAMFDLPYVIFRPHNVYGPRQNIGDRYRNVIGIFMNQALRGEPFSIFGDGTQTRAFSFISDVAPIIARCCERAECYNQVFNVGADQPYTINLLSEVVAKAMGVELRRNYLSARKEVVHAYSSHEKVRKYFGDLVKNVPLEEGVRSMAEWAKRHGSRQGNPFRAIEVMKNIPQWWLDYVATSG